MSRIQYVISAVILLGMLAILALFIVLPKTGPFESGVTPSLVDNK